MNADLKRERRQLKRKESEVPSSDSLSDNSAPSAGQMFYSLKPTAQADAVHGCEEESGGCRRRGGEGRAF